MQFRRIHAELSGRNRSDLTNKRPARVLTKVDSSTPLGPTTPTNSHDPRRQLGTSNQSDRADKQAAQRANERARATQVAHPAKLASPGSALLARPPALAAKVAIVVSTQHQPLRLPGGGWFSDGRGEESVSAILVVVRAGGAEGAQDGSQSQWAKALWTQKWLIDAALARWPAVLCCQRKPIIC